MPIRPGRYAGDRRLPRAQGHEPFWMESRPNRTMSRRTNLGRQNRPGAGGCWRGSFQSCFVEEFCRPARSVSCRPTAPASPASANGSRWSCSAQVPGAPRAARGRHGADYQHLVLFSHIALGHEKLFLEYIPHLRDDFVHPANVDSGHYMPPQEPGCSTDLHLPDEKLIFTLLIAAWPSVTLLNAEEAPKPLASARAQRLLPQAAAARRLVARFLQCRGRRVFENGKLLVGHFQLSCAKNDRSSRFTSSPWPSA